MHSEGDEFMDTLLFQYCPKLAVFSMDCSSVLLCRRQEETYYNGTFGFIGGKMEHKDQTVMDALKREKTEEVGESFRVRVLPYCNISVFFTKTDGTRVILPYYYAMYVSGGIRLNEEYSEYMWVPLPELETFEPKIPDITWIVFLLAKAAVGASEKDFILL